MMMVSMRFSRWMVGYSPAVTADTNPSSKGEGICSDDVLIKCECVGILGLCKRKLQKRDIFPNFFFRSSFIIFLHFYLFSHLYTYFFHKISLTYFPGSFSSIKSRIAKYSGKFC